MLLILAGITISALSGENGIIQKAEQAKNAYTESSEKEIINLAISTIRINLEDIKQDNLKEEIENINGADTVEVNEIGTNLLKVKFNQTENTYTVTKNGELIDIQVILDADYEIRANKIYIYPYIKNWDSLMEIMPEDELAIYLVQDMTQEQKEHLLLDMENCSKEDVSDYLQTIDELLNLYGYSTLDEMLEDNGFSTLDEMLLGGILSGDVPLEMYMFIEYPNGLLVNRGVTDEYVYPAETEGTYKFKIRFLGIEIEKNIEIEPEKTFQEQIPTYSEDMKKLKQGDYVIYDTGIDNIGEITCRVLYDANSEYGLQIIPDECIKDNGEYVDVTLGIDSLEDTSSENKQKALEIYNNAIQTLNTKTRKYINKDYVIDARCVGSNPKDENTEAKDFAEYNEITYEAINGDTNYETDYNTLEELNILDTEKSYWLASRNVEPGYVYSQQGILCYVRMVGQTPIAIYRDNEMNKPYDYSDEVTNGIRPVFLLKGDLNIKNGDGKTESTAYRFN